MNKYKYTVFVADPECYNERNIYHTKKFTHEEFVDILIEGFKKVINNEYEDGKKQGYYSACCGYQEIEFSLYSDKNSLIDILVEDYGFEKEIIQDSEIKVDLSFELYKVSKDRKKIDENMNYLSRECYGRCVKESYSENCPKLKKENFNSTDWMMRV